jgi:hypothetical protein
MAHRVDRIDLYILVMKFFRAISRVVWFYFRRYHTTRLLARKNFITSIILLPGKISNCVKSIYIPSHNKGARDRCENCRTIALIPHVSKIMLHIIQERLKSYLYPQISPSKPAVCLAEGQENKL